MIALRERNPQAYVFKILDLWTWKEDQGVGNDGACSHSNASESCINTMLTHCAILFRRSIDMLIASPSGAGLLIFSAPFVVNHLLRPRNHFLFSLGDLLCETTVIEDAWSPHGPVIYLSQVFFVISITPHICACCCTYLLTPAPSFYASLKGSSLIYMLEPLILEHYFLPLDQSQSWRYSLSAFLALCERELQ